MPASISVKTRPGCYRTVGVIASVADFRLASRMRRPPDFFELRLDCLFPAKGLEDRVSNLPAPIIITARHPAEGGENRLSLRVRRELLLRFLSCAQYVDVELRSARALSPLLDLARRRGVGLILSFHDFGGTPRLGSLRAKARAARTLHPAIFKVATRTDTPAELARLLDFAATNDPGLVLAAMGIGKLGPISRLLLFQCGSALVYTSLRQPRVEGQISLTEFRKALKQIGID